MSPIQYRGFWDKPLAFIVNHKAHQLLFWRDFDEVIDEYGDSYRVYVLPNIPICNLAMPASWEELPKLSCAHLGTIAVRDIKFDSTCRKEVDTSVIDEYLQKNHIDCDKSEAF